MQARVYSHTKGKHWMIVLIRFAPSCFIFEMFSEDQVMRLPPPLIPLFQFPRFFSPAHRLWALHVQMQSAVVLFRAYDLPVVSWAQGGSLISTGSAIFTGSLSVLSSAKVFV